MNALAIIVGCLLVYVIIQLVKSTIMGPAFSIIKWLIHGEDYLKWFKFKQSYIPAKHRINFAKAKIDEYKPKGAKNEKRD